MNLLFITTELDGGEDQGQGDDGAEDRASGKMISFLSSSKNPYPKSKTQMPNPKSELDWGIQYNPGVHHPDTQTQLKLCTYTNHCLHI